LKILFLSSWFPYPPDNGSRVRAYHLVSRLARVHELTLIALADEDVRPDHTQALRALVTDVMTHPRPLFHPRRLQALAGFASRRPRSLVDTYDHRLANLIRGTAAGEKFDVIIAGELAMAAYAAELDHPVKLFDDVETGIFADSAARARGLARVRAVLTWRKFANYLRTLAARFQALTVVSLPEQNHLRAIGIPAQKIHIIPNGIECQGVPTGSCATEPFSMIYPGALTYDANLDAMRFFAGEILPRIRSVEPRAHLRITGRAPQVAINELSRDNAILLTGYVPDVRPLISSSQVCIVPLRVGGGTRLKILEAMMLGTPVVSTPKGAEGLDLEAGEHLLVAETPESFAHATTCLFRDAALRARLTRAARERVCQMYDWTGIGDRMELVIQDALAG
jgi:sugar transferase (PEP-CTERM/EpsH1 system associated)